MTNGSLTRQIFPTENIRFEPWKTQTALRISQSFGEGFPLLFNKVVVSKIFSLQMDPIWLAHIFQIGLVKNHQLVNKCSVQISAPSTVLPGSLVFVIPVPPVFLPHGHPSRRHWSTAPRKWWCSNRRIGTGSPRGDFMRIQLLLMGNPTPPPVLTYPPRPKTEGHNASRAYHI